MSAKLILHSHDHTPFLHDCNFRPSQCGVTRTLKPLQTNAKQTFKHGKHTRCAKQFAGNVLKNGLNEEIWGNAQGIARIVVVVRIAVAVDIQEVRGVVGVRRTQPPIGVVSARGKNNQPQHKCPRQNNGYDRIMSIKQLLKKNFL